MNQRNEMPANGMMVRATASAGAPCSIQSVPLATSSGIAMRRRMRLPAKSTANSTPAMAADRGVVSRRSSDGAAGVAMIRTRCSLHDRAVGGVDSASRKPHLKCPQKGACLK